MLADVAVFMGTDVEPLLSMCNTEEESLGRYAEEQDLLLRLQSGDAYALAAVYDAYSRLVYSVALRVLRDPAQAEDVLQDVFLKIWRRPTSFCASRGCLGSWLAVVARNRAIDFLRRRESHEDLEDVQVTAPIDVGAEVERTVLIERVRQILPTIPKEQLKVLEMAFFQGMTHTEIAASTGLPLGTIKGRIRTAVQVLGRALRQTSSISA